MTTLKPLTAAEIEAGEKLCDGATPGPWRFGADRSGGILLLEDGRGYRFAQIDDGQNGEFIATSRTLLPRALADAKEAIELRAKLAAATNALRAIVSGDIPTGETGAVAKHALGESLTWEQRQLARDCYYDADPSVVTIPEDLR